MELPLVSRQLPATSATTGLHLVEGLKRGPTLLLLHGVARNWRDWQPLLPELSKAWHVVALDHRGHGQSERASSYRVIDYARDAVRFLQEEFAEPITIVGHSLGAM